MKSYTLSLVMLCTALAISGCTSLVYAPAIHLSEKPLAEKDVEIRGSVGMFPETRTQYAEHKTTIGGSMEVGYGFTDNFSLYLSGWLAFSDDETNRGGWALSSRLPLVQNDHYELMLYPRAALLFNGSDVSGYGVELPIVFLRRFSAGPTGVYAYAGAGFAYGLHKFEKMGVPQPSTGVSGEVPEQTLPDGYGIIGHIGIGWNITGALRLTGELNPIMQINSYDNRNDVILSPSVSAAYIIR